MEKRNSQKTGREFWVTSDESHPKVHEGLPVFSLSEIEQLKKRPISKEELNWVMDAKIELGVSLAEVIMPKVVALPPDNDIPLYIERPTKGQYDKAKFDSQVKIAQGWLQKIQATINAAEIRK